MPHLLGLAAGRGAIVLGPIVDGAHAFARASDWLGHPPDRRRTATPRSPSSRAATWPRTARRARGDLAAWSGLGLRDARAGLAAIAGELEEHGELVDLAGRAAPGALPPRLLPAFDPYLLGWRDRGFAVAAEHARTVHPGGGMVRATAIADGRAVATWTMPGGAVKLDPFAPLDAALESALSDESSRVAAFGDG